MKVLKANISENVLDFFLKNLNINTDIINANCIMHNKFGFNNFFDNFEDFEKLKFEIKNPSDNNSDVNRDEYGDFQTNLELSDQIVRDLKTKNASPTFIIEPTCGKGNFIISSLLHFDNVKKIIGVEIYKPYIWECKFNIIDFYLKNPKSNKPEILITHSSVFDYNFNNLIDSNDLNEYLIIGNPPWVTNSKLSILNSSNLPQKTNFKNHNGIDAITGKGNFDIAEFITLMMIKSFQHQSGNIALLVKNSVIKNIIHSQRETNYSVSDYEKHCIDSKKEFNASVEAALFYCKLGTLPSYICREYDFYNKNILKSTFGWISEKFVSNVDSYSSSMQIDGKCPFEWRQGLKHDCSSVMELEKIDNLFINKLNETIELEEDLIFPLLKSSDLKGTVLCDTRKYTIVTQKKVGQDTSYIKINHPKTYKYLIDHFNFFELRKSKIYNGKPPFSIFGVGEYSFNLYKVAISGLYKSPDFSLILPHNNKAIMLDDTCYMLSFEKIEFAAFTFILLNSDISKEFLNNVTFKDAKRTFTKDILMRIDILKISDIIPKSTLECELENLNKKYSLNISLNLWSDFKHKMQSIHNRMLF